MPARLPWHELPWHELATEPPLQLADSATTEPVQPAEVLTTVPWQLAWVPWQPERWWPKLETSPLEVTAIIRTIVYIVEILPDPSVCRIHR